MGRHCASNPIQFFYFNFYFFIIISVISLDNSCFCDGDKVSLSNKVMKSMLSIVLLRLCSKARASDFTLEVIRVAACITSRL